MESKNLNNCGNLVISLDFELLWGVFDKVDHTEKSNYFLNTRKVIPQLLELFENYNIHVTWATVGMLFNENWEEWLENIPNNLPDYENQKLSAYRYADHNRDYIDDELCFAHYLIEKISKTKGQEIGTHTYSHYYCMEPGQSSQAFLEDLKTAKILAERKNILLKSLVFPRNQFNPKYLEICRDLGITTIRTNPSNWYWQNPQKDSFFDKIFRTGDAYLGLKDKSYSLDSLIEKSDYPIQQKSSRFLRPRETELRNRMKLVRIFDEITYAAKNKKVYHLWWHPHNFGNDPLGNLEDLNSILQHYKKCEQNYGMVSKNMGEMAKTVNYHKTIGVH